MKALKKLHRYLYLGGVLLCFLLHAPCLFWWARDPEKHYERLVRARRRMGLWSSAFVGIRYRIVGNADIDWTKPYIICANHTSNLDITALVVACKGKFSFIGKQELLNNPVTGLFFRTIDLPLNRGSKISAFRVFKKAETLLKKSRSIAIFPEGTIHAIYPPILGSFKNGPFRMAVDAQVPILPLIIHDAWKCCWDDGKAYGMRPGTIRVEILEPVLPQPGQSYEQLKEQLYQIMGNAWLGKGFRPQVETSPSDMGKVGTNAV